VRASRFLALWTLAVVATSAAFIVHLALRGRTVDLGYQLGKARNEQAALRETKRVLELEAASYRTPERVEKLARTLLGMTPPTPERVIPLRSLRSSGPSRSPSEPAATGASPAAPDAVVPARANAAPGGTP
jgi:cell division protein FtsL